VSLPSAETLRDLLVKYDRPGPRYTSYPTAVEFHDGFGPEDYEEHLARADEAADEPLSLYVHVPFCESRCTFCGCYVVVTRKEEVPPRYLASVDRELALLAERLPRRRRLAQYHWGGGTPTHLTPDQMRRLQASVLERFTIDEDAEVAVEIDPRETTDEDLEVLRELGFNRISIGVQDFTPEVQVAIGRGQTEAGTRHTYGRCRELGFASVNLDLIYGLPRQTPETFRASLETVLDLRPDRVAVYSYAHVPWIRPHQKRIREEDLPDRDTKLALFGIAMEMFRSAGYLQIGMDHFSLPGDELARAVENGTLHRNFMGYTVKAGSDMLGVGVSAIGDVRGAFAQNTKKLAAYDRELASGRLPVEKGYRLVGDDALRRHVITSLMCNFALDRREVERRFDIDFAATFGPELSRLREAEEEGFLTVTADRIEVAPLGRLFIRNVCMTFDRYLKEKLGDRPVFSRTV
jgi:oxygen-independent coproporphyrinogen-3 oxidase